MKVFQPIIFLLNKLKYSVKFLIVGCILIVPLFSVSVFFLKNKAEDMNHIEKRLEGADYNILLKDLLQYTQQSRALEISNQLGNKTDKEILNEVSSKVNNTFDQLEKKQSEMKYDFNIENQLKEIRELWDTLEKTSWTSTQHVSSEYSYFNGKIINLMADVTNNSGLLLAESKEEYNLVYNATIELPKLMEQLSELQSVGLNIINNNLADANSLKQINEIYYPMQSTIEDMLNRSMIILNDANLEGELKEPLELLYNSTAIYLSEIAVIGKEPIAINDFNETATKSIDKNLDFYTASIDVMKSKLQEEYKQLKLQNIFNFIALIITCIISLILFISLYFAIKQSISKLAKSTNEVANGNLNVELALNTNDEMKEVETAFNSMTRQLKGLVKEILVSAEHVAASSQQLSASTQEATASVDHVTTAVSQISSETDIQAESLNESAQAMNEMVVGIGRIAENSVKISSLTNEATQFADEGNQSVDEVLKQMEMINETVEKTSEKINDLNKHSAEIDSIVNVISEIAEQTNLLALNAAIEAARAGEHGKGFAVVADAVRKLAEQSRESTKKISEIIRKVQKDTSNSVEMMEVVTNNVHKGIEVTNEAAYKFNHILTSMQTLNPQMEDISSTTTEFSAQVEQVATSIKNLLDIVQQTSNQTTEISSSSQEQLAIMEEIATSATSLSEMAESLQNLVAKFELKEA